MRVAIYARVSTLDQSTAVQKQELAQYIAARGWQVISTFEDHATGTNTNRTDFRRMMADARARRFDSIVVYRLDRAFRSLSDMLMTLQELNDLGVAFVSLRDGIDLSTATGKLMAHVLGAFAEFEASLLRMRVRAGLDAARRKGVRLGRRPSVDRAAVLRLRADGRSYRQIAKALGISHGAIADAIRSDMPDGAAR
jgi:DNA invertase Pin-like site-specific DNA recombinase